MQSEQIISALYYPLKNLHPAFFSHPTVKLIQETVCFFKFWLERKLKRICDRTLQPMEVL